MDHGINHAKQDVVEEVMRLTGDKGVDLVFEHVGGELFQKGLDSLGKDGRLVTCGAHAGEVVPFDIIPFFRSRSRSSARSSTPAQRSRSASSSASGQDHAARPRRLSARGDARGDGDDGAPRAVRQDRPQAGARRVKRLGVDVGGTFTDLIYVDDEAGQILVHKLATTPTIRPEDSGGNPRARRARRDVALGARPGLSRTTIATNIVIEHNGSQVGLITTEGYRDILHIARHKKPLNSRTTRICRGSATRSCAAATG